MLSVLSPSERSFYIDLQMSWDQLDLKEKIRQMNFLSGSESDRFFSALPIEEQGDILKTMDDEEAKHRLALMPPDDLVDVIQSLSKKDKFRLKALLSEKKRADVIGLLAYAEDQAGGLMTPQFIRLRPNMGVEEAIQYVRQQIADSQRTIYYIYVLDSDQRLLGLVSFKVLLSASPKKIVTDIMTTPVVRVQEETPQAEIAAIFQRTGYMAIPVVNFANRMQGIVTVTDVVNVVKKEATREIHRSGATEALDAPYFKVQFFSMFKKRIGWLAFLCIGEMFTATAMSYYENELQKAVVLALFIPLIISSGGNSGSQASTLVVRSLALGEIKLRDWWKIISREIGMGACLGFVLGLLGLIRVLLWPSANTLYGVHYHIISTAIASSLFFIVTWGTLVGATLPLILKRLSFDPATACAPLVATIVDVFGLVIYFTVAKIILTGTVL